MKQRIIALAVALFMLLTMVPVTGNVSWAADSHKHVYDESLTEIVLEPTCKKEGKAYVWCECGKSRLVKKLAKNAKAHTWVISPAEEATCLKEGKTEGRYCSECGLIGSIQTTINKKFHVTEIIPAVPATCTTAGTTEGSKCINCGTVTSEPRTVSAKGHTKKTVKGYAATCEAEGLSNGYVCSVCGIVLEEQRILAKKDHEEVADKLVKPTCTKDGKTSGKHCSVCNKVIVAQRVIPALGHKEEVISGSVATCTKDGKTKGKKCTVCNAVTVKQKVIKASGHNEVTKPAVALTCTKNGKTKGKYCTKCNEVLTEQYVIYTFGHNTREKIVKKATKKSKGLAKSTCAVCKKALGKRSIPKIGTVKLSETFYVYDLTSHTPEVIINDANGKPIDESNYTLTVPAERMFTGKYTYTVKFKNEYSGTLKMTLKIAPKVPAINTPVALKNGLTAKWDKIYGKATGYEVMVATNSKFTKGKKTVTVKNLNASSKKITGLKGGTTYWVKVRGYKSAGKEKIYSSWSEVKQVKTK